MPKYYGKLVDSLLTKTSKSWVRLSTHMNTGYVRAVNIVVKARLFPTTIPRFYAHISPAYSVYSPLAEHIFYPVSTAPITTVTKEKIKER